MLTWNDFKCNDSHASRHRIDNFGDYSQLWCGRLRKYIINCNDCPYNEKEKEMCEDPNNYQEWLRRHKNERA